MFFSTSLKIFVPVIVTCRLFSKANSRVTAASALASQIRLGNLCWVIKSQAQANSFSLFLVECWWHLHVLRPPSRPFLLTSCSQTIQLTLTHLSVSSIPPSANKPLGKLTLITPLIMFLCLWINSPVMRYFHFLTALTVAFLWARNIVMSAYSANVEIYFSTAEVSLHNKYNALPCNCVTKRSTLHCALNAQHSKFTFLYFLTWWICTSNKK